MTFKTKLGMVLPRSTEFQAELGESVDKNQLRAGDLVFFRTGRTDRHVGVYWRMAGFCMLQPARVSLFPGWMKLLESRVLEGEATGYLRRAGRPGESGATRASAINLLRKEWMPVPLRYRLPRLSILRGACEVHVRLPVYSNKLPATTSIRPPGRCYRELHGAVPECDALNASFTGSTSGEEAYPFQANVSMESRESNSGWVSHWKKSRSAGR